MQNPSGFKRCKWNATMSIRKSRSERALSISRKIGNDRKYIAKGLELDGNPRKVWMERNRPVETSQPVKEDNLFKQTGCSGNFPIGSTKNMCSIYCLSGITGIFMSMVNNPEHWYNLPVAYNSIIHEIPTSYLLFCFIMYSALKHLILGRN